MHRINYPLNSVPFKNARNPPQILISARPEIKLILPFQVITPCAIKPTTCAQDSTVDLNSSSPGTNRNRLSNSFFHLEQKTWPKAKFNCQEVGYLP